MRIARPPHAQGGTKTANCDPRRNILMMTRSYIVVLLLLTGCGQTKVLQDTSHTYLLGTWQWVATESMQTGEVVQMDSATTGVIRFSEQGFGSCLYPSNSWCNGQYSITLEQGRPLLRLGNSRCNRMTTHIRCPMTDGYYEIKGDTMRLEPLNNPEDEVWILRRVKK